MNGCIARVILGLVVAGIFAATSAAAENTVKGPVYYPVGKVLEYGIYKIADIPVERYKPETNAGHMIGDVSDLLGPDDYDWTLVEKTDQVPLFIGQEFWFEYVMTGLPDGMQTLQFRVSHPPMKNEDGIISAGYTYRKDVEFLDGYANSWAGWGIDYAYEMVEGRWEFEFSYQGRVILNQQFYTYIDAAAESGK